MADDDDNFPPLINFIFPINSTLPPTLTTLKQRCTILLSDNSHIATSVLLQAALSVSVQDEKVCYVLDKPLNSLPQTVHLMPNSNPATLRNVQFIYTSDIRQVEDFLASIHLKQPFPALILLDNLNNLFKDTRDEDWDFKVAKFLALLWSTSQFLSKKRNQICPVIVRYRDNDVTLKMNIWKLFFTQIWTIESENQHFNLHVNLITNLTSDFNIKFNVMKDQLFLDEIYRVTK